MRLWLLTPQPSRDILLHRNLTSLLLSWPDHISCPTKRTSEGYLGLGASNICLRAFISASGQSKYFLTNNYEQTQTRPGLDQCQTSFLRSGSPTQGSEALTALRSLGGSALTQLQSESWVPCSITRFTKALYSRPTCIVILTWSVW